VADQQLVEIARALSLDSRLVILDEPTAVLSLPEREKLFSIIAGLRRDGIAVLYISHRLDEIFTLSQRVSVFRDGRLVSTADTAAVTERDVVRQMIGGEVDALQRISVAHHQADCRIRASNGVALLEVMQQTGPARRTFTVGAGEIVGIAGFVGSGRSRLGRTIAGLKPAGSTPRRAARADAQVRLEVRLEGRPIDVTSPAEASASGIVYLTEDRKRDGLFRPLDVLANTSAASLHRISTAGVIRFSRERALCESLLNRMRLKAASLRSGVHELSGGNQQKVVFARGLLQEPKVLICDEPTRGVDVGAKREIHQLLIALAEHGVAILVISSEFSELKLLCDRFLVMSGGAVVADLRAEEASEERLLAIASGLGDGARPRSAAGKTDRLH
jgi:ABC-type sugar transport system ATPase subunit